MSKVVDLTGLSRTIAQIKEWVKGSFIEKSTGSKWEVIAIDLTKTSDAEYIKATAERLKKLGCYVTLISENNSQSSRMGTDVIVSSTYVSVYHLTINGNTMNRHEHRFYYNGQYDFYDETYYFLDTTTL